MLIAGIDFSSHAVDLVTIPLDEGPPEWHQYLLKSVGGSFDRTREVAATMPGRADSFWDDILAVGIEYPAGRYGTGALMRVQGAILSCIPGHLKVQELQPAKWKKLVGLPGYADKATITASVRLKLLLELEVPPIWPQDACDAWCIAQATRTLLEQEHPVA